MIDGLILGLMAWASLFASWWHLPEIVKNYTKRHPVQADIAAGFIAFTFLSGVSKSLIAVVGTIVATLLVNFTIIYMNSGKQHGHSGLPNKSE